MPCLHSFSLALVFPTQCLEHKLRSVRPFSMFCSPFFTIFISICCPELLICVLKFMEGSHTMVKSPVFFWFPFTTQQNASDAHFYYYATLRDKEMLVLCLQVW